METDKLSGVGPYGEAKIKAEEICEEYRKKGLCIPVIRPKSFIGPERLGVFALLYDWAKSAKNFPMIGSGKNRYQLLDVEDLCEAIYLAATSDGNKANDTFNVGAKDFTTMKEDYQVVLDKAGFGKKIIGLPAKKDALLRNYQWYMENKEKFENKSGVTHRVPWSQGILRLIKVFF